MRVRALRLRMQGCDAMKLTIHDGELARYLVHCKHAGKPKRVFVPYESDVLVFATSPEDAKIAAAEKLQDKWLRHRGVHTEWRATDVRLDWSTR